MTGYHDAAAVRWAAVRHCPMGWFEAVARVQSPALTLTRSCVELETLMENGSDLSDTVRVGFMSVGEPFRSGPRKGQRRYDKKSLVNLYVTRTQVYALEQDYKTSTGLCPRCIDGRRSYGWSKDTGPMVESCRDCGGTGKAK